MSLKIINTETSQLVREVSRKLDSFMYPVSDDNNLTIMKFKVLMEIDKKKQVNIGEVGQALGIAGGNISNMCKALEKEGYLKRTRSTEDERVVTVGLTSHGEDVLRNIKNQLEEKFSGYDDTMTDEEYHQIIDSLVLLNNHLDKLAQFE